MAEIHKPVGSMVTSLNDIAGLIGNFEFTPTVTTIPLGGTDHGFDGGMRPIFITSPSTAKQIPVPGLRDLGGTSQPVGLRSADIVWREDGSSSQLKRELQRGVTHEIHRLPGNATVAEIADFPPRTLLSNTLNDVVVTLVHQNKHGLPENCRPASPWAVDIGCYINPADRETLKQVLDRIEDPAKRLEIALAIMKILPQAHITPGSIELKNAQGVMIVVSEIGTIVYFDTDTGKAGGDELSSESVARANSLSYPLIEIPGHIIRPALELREPHIDTIMAAYEQMVYPGGGQLDRRIFTYFVQPYIVVEPFIK